MRSVLLISLLALSCQKSVNISNELAPNSKNQNIIAGREESDMQAVVQLTASDRSICTGAVVGLNPPTVLTARHCIEAKTTKLLGVEADKVTFQEFEDKSFESDADFLPGDAAVLIFPQSLSEKLNIKPEDLFTVSGPTPQWQDPVSFCGYGRSLEGKVYVHESSIKRCGSNILAVDNKKFIFTEFLLPVTKRFAANPDLVLNAEEKVKFAHYLIQELIGEYGLGTRLGVGRFNASAFERNPVKGFEETATLSLVANGDSGGPWFMKRAKNPQVIGISSFGATNRLTGTNTASFAWRVDHPWTQSLLSAAFKEGADILGFKKR